MMLKIFTAFLLLSFVGSRKVYNHDEEIEFHTAEDVEKFKEEAELIESEDHPNEECEFVTDRLDTYRVYTRNEEGVEEEDHVQLQSRVNQIIQRNVSFVDLDSGIADNVFVMMEIRDYLNCHKADSPELIKAIKDDILQPPNKEAYNIPQNKVMGEGKQGLLLNTVIFKEKVKDGFFLEFGAGDFVGTSNTVLLEMKENWSGMLIEPHALEFKKGLKTNRKAHSANVCLTTKDMPVTNQIQCFPLYSLILAAERKINYMSLYTEDNILDLFKSVPWDKVDVEVISVDNHYQEILNEGNKEKIRQFMKEQNYILVEDLIYLEDVFIRKDMYEGDYKPDLETLKAINMLDIDKLAMENFRDLKKDNLFSYVNWQKLRGEL